MQGGVPQYAMPPAAFAAQWWSGDLPRDPFVSLVPPIPWVMRAPGLLLLAMEAPLILLWVLA